MSSTLGYWLSAIVLVHAKQVVTGRAVVGVVLLEGLLNIVQCVPALHQFFDLLLVYKQIPVIRHEFELLIDNLIEFEHLPSLLEY